MTFAETLSRFLQACSCCKSVVLITLMFTVAAHANPPINQPTEKTPMPITGQFTLVKASELSSDHRLPFWMDDKWYIIVYEGDLTLDRHLLLDWERTRNIDASAGDLMFELFEPRLANRLHGLIVKGNLTVKGAILNTNMDGGPLLIVTGKTTAAGLLAGGAYIEFRGEAQFDDAIFANYNHGELIFEGPVTAGLLYNSDHMLDMRHPDREKNIGVYFNDMENDTVDDDAYDEEENLPAAVQAVVLPELKSSDDIYEHLSRGNRVLK